MMNEQIRERFMDHFDNYCVRTNRRVYVSAVSYEEAEAQIGKPPTGIREVREPRDEFGERI